MAPQQHVGWGAAGVSTPIPMTQYPGATPGAAPGSSSGRGCILVAALCSTQSSPLVKHLSPLLTIPQG